jgi:chromosome partitioning protein
MRTLVIANQKGGVGKTTLTAHLGYAAVERRLRTLLVEMDTQGNLSLTFAAPQGAKPGLLASSLYSSESNSGQPQTISEYLSIIRADKALLSVDKAENEILRRPGQALRRFADDFDLCLIDTPPLLGLRLIASLTAADYVVTPVSVGLYELSGVADLMQTIRVVRTQGFNPRLKHIGILPMKVNNRSSDEREGLASLRQSYPADIRQEVIAERAAVKKAVARRVPVWTGTKGEGHLKAAQEWRAACESILGSIGI